MAKKAQQRLGDLAALMGHMPNETAKVTIDEVTVTSKTVTIEGEVLREQEEPAAATIEPANEPAAVHATEAAASPDEPAAEAMAPAAESAEPEPAPEKAAAPKKQPRKAKAKVEAEPVVDETERMRRIMLLRPWVNTTARPATEADRAVMFAMMSGWPKAKTFIEPDSIKLIGAFLPWVARPPIATDEQRAEMLKAMGVKPAAEVAAKAEAKAAIAEALAEVKVVTLVTETVARLAAEKAKETPATETPEPELQPGERRTAGGQIVRPFIPVVERKSYKDRLAESQQAATQH